MVPLPTSVLRPMLRLVWPVNWTWGSTVYVARVRRDNGKMAMSRPCRDCERVLRSRGVRKVFYTIGPKEYGVMEFGK